MSMSAILILSSNYNMTKQEAIQAQIDEIMDTFDFEKVHAWMEHAGWVWSGAQEEVPSTSEIRRQGRQRLIEASIYGFSSCGGFTASREQGFDQREQGDGQEDLNTQISLDDQEDQQPWIKLNLHFGYTSHNDGTTYNAL